MNSEKDSQEGQQCPECGQQMERKKIHSATRSSGEQRHSVTVKDICDCGTRDRVEEKIGDPI